MMIFIIFLLNLIVFSKDVSILWIASDKDSVDEILEFKKQNNLNFDMDVILNYNVDISTDFSFSLCDIFGKDVPLLYLFFPSTVDILKNRFYDNQKLFNLVFDNYYERFDSKKCILFYPALLSEDIIKAAYKNNYLWIAAYRFNEKSNVYDYNGMKIVFFDKLVSTDSIYSQSSFFILDDVSASTSSVSLLKSIFSDKTINFVRTTENFEFRTSTISFSTTSFQLNISSPVFSCERERNYFYYLLFLNLDLSKVLEIDNILNDYITLINYYKLDEIRNISSYIYQILRLKIPAYLYDDFLIKKIIPDYIKTIKDDSVYYIGDLPEKPVFVVSENEDELIFNIKISSSVSNFYIYIDVNKLSRVGIGKGFMGETFYYDFAWEYAFVINKNKVLFYKIDGINYKKVKDFDLFKKQDLIFFKVKKSEISGNFLNWDYILIYYLDTGERDGIYYLVSEKFFKPVK